MPNVILFIFLRNAFFLKNNFTYLFNFDCAGFSLLCRLFWSCGKQELLSSCSARASHCSGFLCSAQALRHAGFSSCGARVQSLQFPGSKT